MKLALTFVLSAFLFIGCGDDDTGEADTAVAPDTTVGTDTAVGTDTNPPMDTGTPPTDTGSGVDTGSMMTGCPSGACTLLPTNGGCEAGQGCYLTGDGLTCNPAGTVTAGGACEFANDCMEGLGCNRRAGEPMGTCTNYCCEGSDEGCPAGEVCLVNLVDGEMEPTGVKLCVLPDGCNVLEQTGCEDGEGCYPVDGGAALCGAAGTVETGGACGAEQCAPGNICITTMPDAPAMCAAVCRRPTGEPSCAEGFACGGITGFPEDIGVCVAM